MKNKNIKKLGLYIVGMAATILLFTAAGTANAKILFQDDSFATIDSGGLILNNYNGYSGNITIQFGQALNKTITYNTTTSRFEINAGLDVGNYQLTTARVENVSALPGGAGGLGAGGTGRVVQLSAVDGVAPGCTGPTCSPGTYSWDGAIWHALQGSITTSNATKIITVGPTGRDYTTIAAGAAYLNGLSGGEMWVDPGSYPVTAAVNLSNIKIRGTDTALTTIALTGAGKLNVINSKFETLTIDINSGITAAMGLDVTYNASSNSAIQLNQVNFTVGTGKLGIDSSSGTKPVTIAIFNQCTQTVGGGNLLNTVVSSGLNAASLMTVINLLSSNPLKVSDWPIKIIGGSNVVTSGTITTVPDRTILVSPGMNIQGSINSLGSSGGVVKLLIGTHDITTSLLINNNNIELVGEGPGTILRAQTATWTGGTTISDAVVQVGTSNGTAPRNNINVRNFVLQVGPNIHGLRINGGAENKVMDMIIQSIGPKNTTRTGLVFTDAAASAGSRFTASRDIINSDASANRWVDGLHMDGDSVDLAGQLFGYGNGIQDSIIYETIVAESKETSYAFTGVRASGIFSNRTRDVGYNSGAFGMFLNNSQDVTMINNTLDGSNNASMIGISLYSDVLNSIVVGNTIRGTVATPMTTAIEIRSGSTTAKNIISDNQMSTVTHYVVDQGANTKLETKHHRASVNPTASDNITIGYDTGTIWINTATQSVYVNTTIPTAPPAAPNTTAVWTRLNNLAATAAVNPTAANDNTQGYFVGSIWINTATKAIFICTSNTTGAAVWKQLSTTVKFAVNPTAANDNTQGYDVGTIWINTAANTSFICANSSTGAAVWNTVGGGGGGTHTQNTDTGTNATSFTLNNGNTNSDVTLNFASNNPTETLTWNNTNLNFDLSDDLNVTGNLEVSGNTALGTTTAANSVLDVNGDLALRKTDYAPAAGNNNNINIGTATYVKMTPSPGGNFVITGIAGGVDGKVIIIHNPTDGARMTISNLSTSSSVGNRIFTNTGGNLQTTNGNGAGSFMLIYDSTDQRWVVMNYIL